MARAQCATIRLKLLKIGAVITRNASGMQGGKSLRNRARPKESPLFARHCHLP